MIKPEFFKTLFNILNIRYTTAYLSELVANTPYNDSLYGISAILSEYNISNHCVKFTDKHDLSNLDTPCIVIYFGNFSIITEVTTDQITLSVNNQYINVPYPDFINAWNGIALLVTHSDNSKEPNYARNQITTRQNSVKRIGIALCILFMVTLCFLNAPARVISSTLPLTINILGIIISVFLLQKQLQIPNKIADKICGLAKESHCETITESDGASLFGLVKLSEVGFGFFLTNTITLIAFPQSSFWLAVYAVCVLPFSFWSIWYQKYKAKSWCVLCLTTLALMWLQAGAYLLTESYSTPNMNWMTPIMIGAIYVLTVLLTNKTMELLDSVRKNGEWKLRYEELKTNDKVISAFIENEFNDTTSDYCSSLLFGNPNADKTLTVFSNPYCGPCAMMHRRIKDLPGDCVNVRYVMTYFSDEKSAINKAIIAAYQQLGANKTWQILTEWFAGGKKEGIDFFKQYDLDFDSPEIETEFHKQCEWPKDKPIYGTPTDLINGREIVWPYSVEDYFYLT